MVESYSLNGPFSYEDLHGPLFLSILYSSCGYTLSTKDWLKLAHASLAAGNTEEVAHSSGSKGKKCILKVWTRVDML